jgi:hypothetical protein
VPATERAEVVTRPSSLSLRDERILLTLVVQTQQLNDRLTRLEDRVEANIRDAVSQPDQEDLLELRLHSARLAAELSRVTIELRAEINDLAAGLAGTSDADDIAPPDVTDRLTPDPDELIDLRDDAAESTQRPSSSRASGWRPARPATRPPGTGSR